MLKPIAFKLHIVAGICRNPRAITVIQSFAMGQPLLRPTGDANYFFLKRKKKTSR